MDAIDWLSAALCAAQVETERELDRVEHQAAVRLRMRVAIGAETGSEWPRSLLARWEFLDDASMRLLEVQQSFECLTNIPTYMRHFPYRSAGVSRAGYLQYHYENWLNEVYILETRFQRFAGGLKTAFRVDASRKQAEAAVKRSVQVLKSGLAAAHEIRGEHVHEARAVDRDILLLGGWERARARNPDAPYDVEKEFRRVRRCKAAELSELNGLILQTLGAAAEPLKEEFVTENDRWPVFRLPSPGQ